MKPAIFMLQAQQEMAEAASFYEVVSPGLGKDFLEQVQEAVRSVQEYPLSGPAATPSARRKRVNRFPYGLFYQNFPDRIVVVAVAHVSRRPGYWADRL